MGSCKTGVCLSLSDSGMGVNAEEVTGESSSAEAVPDGLADVQCNASMWGAETVVHQHVNTHVAGVVFLFCNSLEANEWWVTSDDAW